MGSGLQLSLTNHRRFNGLTSYVLLAVIPPPAPLNAAAVCLRVAGCNPCFAGLVPVEAEFLSKVFLMSLATEAILFALVAVPGGEFPAALSFTNWSYFLFAFCFGPKSQGL